MKEFLKPKIKKALEHIGAPADTTIVLERPKQSEHGDLATSVALSLAKVLKKKPRDIASDLRNALMADTELTETLLPASLTEGGGELIDIAGPGFLNFRFSPRLFQNRLDSVLQRGDEYGRTLDGAGKSVNVEYVSANPTGPLHPGHGRNAALGDTIASTLAWTGYKVTREYYFNNAGNQMRNLARSIHARYLELLGHDPEFPEDGYHGDYIIDIAKDLVASRGNSLEEATDENMDTVRFFGEEWNFNTIRKTMENLGIHHDSYFNESSLYEAGKIEETIAKLNGLNKTYEQEGALYLKLEGTGKGRKDRVIVKSSGEPTYRLPDIAYHIEKLERDFDLIIDVLGADHIDAVPDVIAAVEMLGGNSSAIQPVIHQMVSFVEGGESVKFSKRSGKAITLDSLVEELSADVVRFFFLMRGVSTHLEFDLDLAREQSDKNPVFYLQYAHARIAGVLRHAKSEGIEWSNSASLETLVADEEISLIKEILEFPSLLSRASRELEPQLISEYLRDLAAAFHKFYHEHRIVGADSDQERDARLRLLEACRAVFRNGLTILGVTAPERM